VDVLQCDHRGILGDMSDSQWRQSDRVADHSRADHRHEDVRHTHGPGDRTQNGSASRILHMLRPHSHETAGKVDAVMEASAGGMRALWLLRAAVICSGASQAGVVGFSGPGALLGAALPTPADALPAVPLAVAFVLGRRPPTRRYTYGYGRAEDMAGVIIVLL